MSTRFTKVKKLKESGIESFEKVMAEKGHKEEELEEILQKYSSPTKTKVRVISQPLREEFYTALDFGRFLVDSIPYTPENEGAIYSELKEIGAWLSLKFITVITNEEERTTEKFRAKNRFIPDLTANGAIYRHHVLGVWKIYGMHREESKIFLSRTPTSYSGTVDYFSLFPDIMESSPVCKVLNKFFWDRNTGEPKKEWTRSKREKVGQLMNRKRATYCLRLINYEKLYQIFEEEL